MKFINPFQENYFIYKITNNINNKIYIGRTKNPSYRRRNHLICSKLIDSSRHLKIHDAINKLGKDNFTFEVFECVNSLNKACEREVFWIKLYRADEEEFGYNYRCGVAGNPILSEDDKKRLSARMTGTNNPMFGKNHSTQTKQKLRENFSGTKNPFYGKKHSEETKKKIGENSSRINAGENNSNSKLSLQNVIDIRKEFINGTSRIDLAKKYKVTAVTISNILSGKTWK